MPRDALTRKLAQRADKEFVYLKRRINPDEARQILAHKIPGVFSQREFRRFYPQGEAMAHMLGFTNIDDLGQEGLELAFDDWLRGKPGAKRVIRDRRGRIVENVDLVAPAEPGHDLTLTIDRRIQYLAYRELRSARCCDTGASSGSAVVLDVATGEVLAMANLPTYNPNAVSGGNRDAHRNRAVTDLIEPGSTMKPLTVAAALEAGVITPHTRFDTNPGWMPNGRYRTTDHHNYGVLDTTGVITKSSNVGAAKIVAQLPNADVLRLPAPLRLRQQHRQRLPGRSRPACSRRRRAGAAPPSRRCPTATACRRRRCRSRRPTRRSATAAALIAPTFVKGQRNEARQVLDPAIAGQVMRMMQTVTEPGGTATQAAILGYHVAGKTGTARKASGPAVIRAATSSFFAGVVPVDNPRFSMVVVINDPDPAKGYYGGLVSGAGVPERHGRRAAPDGRAAGRHRDLAGGAGRSRGQARQGQRRQAVAAAVLPAPAQVAVRCRCRPALVATPGGGAMSRADGAGRTAARRRRRCRRS